MKLLCISTFDNVDQIKNLSFNKVYDCKFIHKDHLFIIDDKGNPKFIPRLNFVNYDIIKNFKNI
jgi:hypothetical protein